MRVVAFLGTSGMDETSLDGHGSKLDFSLFMEETEENEFSEPWFFCGYADSAGCIPARGVRAFIVQSLESENLVGGSPVPQNQYLYSVYIQIGPYKCGGAIIHEQYVVTAAHCVFHGDGSFARITPLIYLGVSDFYNSPLKEVVTATDAFVPGQYQRNFQNPLGAADIAILKLQDPLKTKYSSAHLALPGNLDLTGMKALFTAYGHSEHPTYNIKDVPKYNIMAFGKHHFAYAKVLHPSECHYLVPTLDPSQFCARIEQSKTTAGTCLGDSGSPLVYENKLIGILATSNEACYEAASPGTYVDIRKFEVFIQNIIEHNFYRDMHHCYY